jgi:thiosulfate dehydrogenase
LGIVLGFLLGATVGAGAGYYAGNYLLDRPVNWYAADISKLGPGPENDLIRYGRDLIVNTPRHIGKNATDPAMRYAGNDLACQNCHLNAGLQPFAAPFVSTFATFPMMVDDQVLTLTDRINGCMRRSLNGKDLPSEGREMEAIVAYLKFVGKGSPEGVRVPGMGLRPIENPTSPPDARRGEAVYAKLCVTCHKDDGQGEPKPSPGVGYSIPPLWGKRASTPAPAWPRPLMPPLISATTCRWGSITGRRCSPCKKRGTWRPSSSPSRIPRRQRRPSPRCNNTERLRVASLTLSRSFPLARRAEL